MRTVECTNRPSSYDPETDSLLRQKKEGVYTRISISRIIKGLKKKKKNGFTNNPIIFVYFLDMFSVEFSLIFLGALIIL